mmetsp:Transcript_6536/g.10031  ORF Transcript_6536/g.10031 Transcript_6536/m.10031 type:complete len:138 (-) Transcript_6536:164-577(-)
MGDETHPPPTLRGRSRSVGGGKPSTLDPQRSTLKAAGDKIAAEIQEEVEHQIFIKRREHLGKNNNKKTPKRTKSAIARGAARILFRGEAVLFSAWRDYVRAKREDAEEMNAIAKSSDVLMKPPWQRTPREIEATPKP